MSVFCFILPMDHYERTFTVFFTNEAQIVFTSPLARINEAECMIIFLRCRYHSSPLKDDPDLDYLYRIIMKYVYSTE